MSVPKIVVHTDIVTDYLRAAGGEVPVLRTVMKKFFCYATVFHAIELFALARTESERRSVEDVLSSMKILGLNARGAKAYGKLLAGNRTLPLMDLLVAGLCSESRLPLLTGRPQEFRSFRGLHLVRPSDVTDRRTAAEVLAAGKRRRR